MLQQMLSLLPGRKMLNVLYNKGRMHFVGLQGVSPVGPADMLASEDMQRQLQCKLEVCILP